jgi:hypothetical protein
MEGITCADTLENGADVLSGTVLARPSIPRTLSIAPALVWAGRLEGMFVGEAAMREKRGLLALGLNGEPLPSPRIPSTPLTKPAEFVAEGALRETPMSTLIATSDSGSGDESSIGTLEGATVG